MPSSLTRGQNHFQFRVLDTFQRKEDGTWWAKVLYQPLDFSTPIVRESKIHRWENKSDSKDVRFCVEILTFRGPEDKGVYADSFFRYPDKEYEYISIFDVELNTS